VGITEFFGPCCSGFRCSFKSKYQDFHVHEVDTTGSEIRMSEVLTKVAVATELREEKVSEDAALDVLGPSFEFCDDAMAHLKALPAEDLEALKTFMKHSREEHRIVEGKPVPLALLGACSDKTQRKAKHLAVKAAYPFLATEMVASTQQIEVFLRPRGRNKHVPPPADGAHGIGKGKGKAKGKGKGKGKAKSAAECDGPVVRWENWPEGQPEFLHFTLYKENRDTGEAINNVSKCTFKSWKHFGFAGTKDRRGVTVQRVSAWRLRKEALKRAILNRLWDRQIRVADLEFRPERIRLGDLGGNRFDVVLREIVDADLETARLNFEHAQDQPGFLNYFGLQRFGTQKIRTHQVGVALLRREWMKAVRMILGDASLLQESARSNEGERATKIQRTEACGRCLSTATEVGKVAATPDDGKPPIRPWHTRDKAQGIREAQRAFLVEGSAQRALELMPMSQFLERNLLGSLAQDLDPLACLQKLPRQQLSLYVHAVQSIVFNHVLSRRIAQFGRTPVAGDLVSVQQAAELPNEGDADPELEGEVASAEGEVVDPRNLEVRVLAPSEVHTCSIFEVVLPLPGDLIEYPGAGIREIYEQVVRDVVGLSLKDFTEPVAGLFPLPGAYRRIVVKPDGVQWSCHENVTYRDNLIPSDIDKLLRPIAHPADEFVADPAQQKQGGCDGQLEPASAPPEGEAAPSNAIVFSCRLPPSAYLTMFMREITRESTGRRPPPHSMPEA